MGRGALWRRDFLGLEQGGNVETRQAQQRRGSALRFWLVCGNGARPQMRFALRRIHGFSTHIARFVDDKLTVIVLMNSGRSDARTLANAIAGHYLPGVTLASVKPPKKDPDPELTTRLKQSLFDLVENKASDAIVPQFREDYARSTNRVTALKQRLENLKSFTFVTYDNPPKNRNGRF